MVAGFYKKTDVAIHGAGPRQAWKVKAGIQGQLRYTEFETACTTKTISKQTNKQKTGVWGGEMGYVHGPELGHQHQMQCYITMLHF